MIKYVSTILLLLLIGTSMQAQKNIDFPSIVLETDADYKNAEPSVIKASDYILTTPFDASDMYRTQAIQFILVWMEGTNDYTFDITALDKLDKEISQTTTFLASLAKYTLENNDLPYDSEAIRNGSFKLFLSYCDNPQNNIKKTRKLKKLIGANKNGTLRQELNK